MKKECHLIVLAGGLQERASLLIPQALVPLGHHPMVCILVKTLLEVNNVSIHLVVSSPHDTIFKREMRRWFPTSDIEVFGSMGSTTSESLLEFLIAKEWPDDTTVVVLQSNFPLLSRGALEHFLHFSEGASSAVLGVNRSKWNEDRALRNLVVEDGRVVSVEKSNFTQLGFLACSQFSTGDLRRHLPGCEDYYEIVAKCEEKPVLVRLHSYPVELDSISIRTTGDKTFAEHKFMEKQHADYLSQCYCIWRECRNLEERIQKLETQLPPET